MAHQDYSEICPIFNEGVEREINFQNLPLSVSLDIGGVAVHKFNRPVIVEEIGAMVQMSSGASASLSCYINILKTSVSQYQSVSAMTYIGSLSVPLVSLSAKTGDTKTGAVWISCQNQAGEVTCTFTSTDWLVLSLVSGKNDTYGASTGAANSL
jgi:hypothetical protein